MAKREIGLEGDGGLAEHAQLLAPAADVDRTARRAALRQLLDDWDHQLGPVSEAAMADARAAFDQVDGSSE